jgi:putative tricarboxylic transport membrane protein
VRPRKVGHIWERKQQMRSLNRDTVIALVLLAITSLYFWETFNIPDPGYASMGSAVWPRVILVPLFVLCVTYLVQSLRRKAEADGKPFSFGTFFATYQNPIYCFIIFFIFLLVIDYLGMLIAGVLVTFALLTAIGNRTPKALLLHLIISVVSVGLVWSLFTYVLRLYMPEGELFRFY